MNRKYKIILALIILISFLSAGKVAADLVTSAENISLSSDKTSKTKVSEALNELYDSIGACPEGKACLNKSSETKKCIRAKYLHNEKCSQTATSLYCSSTNTSYNGSDIVSGSTITYGNYGTTGTIATGDAFTCDVNGDGYYDETTERFYYVSDLWEGSTNTFDTNYAVLIYYSNTIISGGNVTQDNGTGVSYYKENGTYNNYSGPITALAHIPNKVEGQWKNVSLKNQTRQIYNESGTTTNTKSGTNYTIQQYTYINKAARLLTTQEINQGCGTTTIKMNKTGSLDTTTCRFLLENTTYSNASHVTGYWLEAPYSMNSTHVWFLDGLERFVDHVMAHDQRYGSVRPALEVLKSDILY